MAGTICLVWIPHVDVKRKCLLDSPTLGALKDAVEACSILSSHVNTTVDRFQLSQIVLTIIMPRKQASWWQIIMKRSTKTQEHKKGHKHTDGHCFICKISYYPSRKFYIKAINLLVAKYPSLADVTGTGYESWTIAIRNKFKNERRKVNGNTVVDQCRAKYGVESRKRTVDRDVAVTEVLERKKTNKRLVIFTSPPEGEDSSSMAAHEEWLCNEGRKVAPDEALIDHRMDITASKRLRKLASMGIEPIREAYPYLMDARRFIQDFSRQAKIEPVESMSQCIAKVLDLAIQKKLKCSMEILQSISVSSTEDERNRRTRHNQAVAALQVLCCNVKEPGAVNQIFVNEDEGTIPVTPCITYVGGDVEAAEVMSLHVDQLRLFDVADAEEGVVSVMAAYWLFGIEYNKKIYNSACLLERLGLKMAYSPLRAVAIKLLNKIV
ncbi:hypothetical protein HPB47_017796 [Ixodes persulcatus]|uniref:Uncharacterized protein n=1 Tax=Ixodes persulcatus TaxID=34615 RepID=A0AC60QMF9_IXOPE|nr:hypothetical protein HPB47_017796 [Ixodes persulcatus]